MTMKSARPVSAQAQNGSSLGSGEISGIIAVATSSASSRSRLTTLPMSERRTPNLAKTRLYSETISPVIRPDKRVRLDPVPKQLGAWILGNDRRSLQSRDSSHEDGSIDDASRPISILSGQPR